MNPDKRALLAISLVSLVIAADVQRATAQRFARSAYQDRGESAAAEPEAAAGTRAFEELPPAGRPIQGQPPIYEHGYLGQDFGGDEFYPHGGCQDGYCGDGYGASWPGDTGWFTGTSSPGQFFFTADYLYVRANFSEAVAYLEQDISQQNLVTRDFHQLDFEYESSYRFGGGYRLCGCGDEIRFLFTRFQSSAEDEVPFSTDILIPFEPGTPPGGWTLIDADVDVKAFDLECAKTIPLCSQPSCGCGDVCGSGCGDCCGPRCPTWDITWSGGLRVADANWSRSYTAIDANELFVGDGVSTMNFEGIGGKIGLEGRRYFFPTGWLSAYMKGDISVLVGDVELEAVRTIDGGSTPDNVIVQRTEARNIIPVTELEAGVTGQLTRNSRLSAGYLLSAWHDLGFRDEFALGQDVFPLRYDDANILGFDGYFVRVELAY